MDTKQYILNTLSDGAFHSGARLARQAEQSRTAIWKQIKALRDDTGLEILSVPGRGYRLRRPLELLCAARIEACLEASPAELLADLEVLDSVDSTNAHLLRRARQTKLPSGAACVAEHQSAGRGRRGRSWVSPYGSNIYLSVHWRFPQGPAALSGFSLAAGLAVVRGLEKTGVSGVGLKWPNDLQWAGRKLGGILIEINGEQDGPTSVVLGVGLNTRLPADCGQSIDQPWADLRQIVGADAEARNRYAGGILGAVLQACADFRLHGFAPQVDAWQRRDVYYGQPVEIHLSDRVIRGTHSGVAADGALLLQTESGVRAFHGGEVSLRS